MVPKCVSALIGKSGKTIDDIDLFIFHQASKLVMDNIIRRLNLPEEKVFINYQQVGNTVSASIPIALKDASDQQCLKKGDLVMLVGFGVGYSWGGCLIEWGGNM
jgi:3-oxoacyl-[acyl-carrier-protein] synthase-3